ncbi:hypothetical protein M427DRAFT_48877 [Gonapodya prolifera JEL478]|uniref:Uncharacterized protein n=1 Tax=Gonapodya prolifera (strain JEL478) TaxID=1344416 RepID=A0A138ZZT5_GONPJ|nr:hypothetical protein M427DRAFT_48877 [Gonapodya prolifera JEL478]|eukprot:KXS09982.1 hypothetical protein M427DRAFT_48877 [Gonapodya prolifera JEL478]
MVILKLSNTQRAAPSTSRSKHVARARVHSHVADANTILDEYESNVPRGGRAPLGTSIPAFSRRLALFARCPGCDRRVPNVDSLFAEGDIIPRDDPIYGMADGMGRSGIGGKRDHTLLCRACRNGDTPADNEAGFEGREGDELDLEGVLDEGSATVKRVGAWGAKKQLSTIRLTVLNPSSSFPSDAFLLPSVQSRLDTPKGRDSNYDDELLDPATPHVRAALLRRHLGSGRVNEVVAILRMEEVGAKDVPSRVVEGRPLSLPHVLLHISSPGFDPLFHHRTVFTPLTLPPGWSSLSELSNALRAALQSTGKGTATATMAFVEPLPPSRTASVWAETSFTPSVLVFSHKTAVADQVTLTVPLRPATQEELRAVVRREVKDLEREVRMRGNDLSDAMEQCRRAGGASMVLEALVRRDGRERSTEMGSNGRSSGGSHEDATSLHVHTFTEPPLMSRTVTVQVRDAPNDRTSRVVPCTVSLHSSQARGAHASAPLLRVLDPQDPFFSFEGHVTKVVFDHLVLSRTAVEKGERFWGERIVEEALMGVAQGRHVASLKVHAVHTVTGATYAATLTVTSPPLLPCTQWTLIMRVQLESSPPAAMRTNLRCRFRVLGHQLEEVSTRMKHLLEVAGRRPSVAAELGAMVPAWARRLAPLPTMKHEGLGRRGENVLALTDEDEEEQQPDLASVLQERSVGCQAGRPLRMERDGRVPSAGRVPKRTERKSSADVRVASADRVPKRRASGAKDFLVPRDWTECRPGSGHCEPLAKDLMSPQDRTECKPWSGHYGPVEHKPKSNTFETGSSLGSTSSLTESHSVRPSSRGGTRSLNESRSVRASNSNNENRSARSWSRSGSSERTRSGQLTPRSSSSATPSHTPSRRSRMDSSHSSRTSYIISSGGESNAFDR